MPIHCIAVGKSMPDWVAAGVATYQKRLQASWPILWTEIPLPKRSKHTSAQENQQREAEKIIKAIPKRSVVIITDVRGEALSTAQLGQRCQQWQQTHATLCIVIGGPDGIAPSLLAKADFTWSLSPLTLPHPLVRIIVTEQLYRAWSIINHHPYHRGD